MKNWLVVGGGSWGITLYNMLCEKGFSVCLYEKDEKRVSFMKKRGRHDLLPWIKVKKTACVANMLPITPPDTVILSVPSQFTRASLCGLKAKYPGAVFDIIIASKGIEISTGKLLSEVAADVFGKVFEKHVFILSGPSHAEEVSKKIPTAVLLAGKNKARLRELQENISTGYFRIYTGNDIKGIQIGGALKNIIAIACGISDGIGLGDNTKAAIMTRGMAEIVRYGLKSGADRETFYGLSGMGDLFVTCSSCHSRNHNFGYFIGKGWPVDKALKKVGMVVEGYYTAEAFFKAAKKAGIDAPITGVLYRILYSGYPVKKAITELMTRKLRNEN